MSKDASFSSANKSYNTGKNSCINNGQYKSSPCNSSSQEDNKETVSVLCLSLVFPHSPITDLIEASLVN